MRSLPLLLALSGCWYMDDQRFQDRVMDVDGDGGLAVRFGGDDCVDDNATIDDCDVDDDGFLSTATGGDDCDDNDATVQPGTAWYADLDADGFGDPDTRKDGCGPPPTGWSTSDADCDDRNASIKPGAEERCDDLDRNCDGDAWADAVDADVSVWVDGDGDGYGAGSELRVCFAADDQSTLAGDCDDNDADISPDADEIGYDGIDQDCDAGNEYDVDGDGDRDAAHGGTDCDDNDPNVHPAFDDGGQDLVPAAPERCDGVDNDCDLLIDDEEADEDQAPGQQLVWYPDGDNDGYGQKDSEGALFCPSSAPVGWSVLKTDCDDEASSVRPGAPEWCNGVDDDCNGGVDDAYAVDAFTAFFDNDGDGFGGQAVLVCGLDGNDFNGDDLADVLTLRDGDCGDNDADVFPDAPELCGDAIRQDCREDLDPDDCDGDGYTAHDATQPDCLDDPQQGGANAAPGREEVCDGVDNDCDGKTDSDDPDVTPEMYPDWFLDLDGDGYGSPTNVASATCDPPANAASNPDDCDDLRRGVHPDADEYCDGLDNDCDGVADDAPVDLEPHWADEDGDGYGAGALDWVCAGTGGWARRAGDCDDADETISPRAVEICDEIDNNCDELVDGEDSSALGLLKWYYDADGDGAGGDTVLLECVDPDGPDGAEWLSTTGDCDDQRPDLTSPRVWYRDVDQDGFAGTSETQITCNPGDDWYTSATDCLDRADLADSASVHPGVSDGCNFRDDDCNGSFDDSPAPNTLGAVLTWADADGDRHGDPASDSYWQCEYLIEFQGRSDEGDDCDDADPDRHPWAPDACDGVDNDCDADIDESPDWSDPLAAQVYVDADLDGEGTYQQSMQIVCDVVAGYSLVGTDCDDADPERFSGATEICDGVDNDCDQYTDDDDAGLPESSKSDRYPDYDQDGYGSGTTPQRGCLGPNWATQGGDCYDGQASVHPGAPELCDAFDNDCDGKYGSADPDLDDPNAQLGWTDLDHDGFGDDALGEHPTCPGDYGVALQGGDCDDHTFSINPGITEIPDNGFDDDCDGTVDNGGTTTAGCVGAQWPDGDNDGWGDAHQPPIYDCAPIAGYVDLPGDCNDIQDVDVPTEHHISAGQEGTIQTALNAAECAVFWVHGSLDLSGVGALNPPAGAHAVLVNPSDEPTWKIRSAPGQSIASLGTGNTALAFVGLDIEAVGTNQRLFSVYNSTAFLTLAETAVSGAFNASAVHATYGYVGLAGVKIAQTAATGTVPEGSALYIGGGVNFMASQVEITDTVGTAASVLLDNSIPLVANGLTVRRSGPVKIMGANPLGVADLSDVYIEDAVDRGLIHASFGTLNLDHAVIVNAAREGLWNTEGTTHGDHLTIAGSGDVAVARGNGSVTLNNCILYDSFGGGGNDTTGTGITLDHCFAQFVNVGTSIPNPIGPNVVFVSWHPNAPSAIVDLHQKATSSGKLAGSDGDDIGAWPSSDPYYSDSDGDGLPDGWELRHLGSTAPTEYAQSDNDAWNNLTEYTYGTSPAVEDTDGDGFWDGTEAYPLDPTAH